MPCDMTYTYDKNLISCDPDTGLSGYAGTEKVDVTVKVYQFGNVDGFGAMALTYLTDPESVEQVTLETDPGLDPVKYPKHQRIMTHTLSGWFPCHCRFLKP